MSEESVIIGTFICIVLLLISSCSFENYKCKTKAEIQQMEYSFGFIQGCMVREKGGKWIDYERYRVMED